MTDEKDFTKLPTNNLLLYAFLPQCKVHYREFRRETLFTKSVIFIVSVEVCVCLSKPLLRKCLYNGKSVLK